MGEDERQGADWPPTRRRYTVAEAAEILGITVEAVRGRIKRNTIDYERTPEGVFVWLDGDQAVSSRQPGHDQPNDQLELVETLKDQIAYLREQLDQERQARTEERRRHDTILAQLTSRIPELEPARDERESPRTDAEASARGDDVPPERETATGEERRSWWQRMFGE